MSETTAAGASHAPEVPIEVDDATGIWTSASMPMLFVPRHFFMNNHQAIEAEIGAERYAEILYDAGYRSAWHWCERAAAVEGITGAAVFEHYMQRLSQRGWGLFHIERLDTEAGTALVRLDHSAFVEHFGRANRKVDYMFTGWFAGAMNQIGEAEGLARRCRSTQLQSAAEDGKSHGLFEVTPG